MKNFTLLFLMSCYLCSCSSNKKTENSLTKDNLKGSVSFVEQRTYKAEYKFGEIQNGSLYYKYTFKYDEKGNEIERNSYISDGSLYYKYTYKYDEKGNEIEENIYSSDGSLSIKYISKYDEKGNKIEYNSYNSDGSLLSKYTYKYDEKGNEIEYNSYNSDGSIDEEETYKYELDKLDNWIKKVSFKNDKPLEVIEWLIEYY